MATLRLFASVREAAGVSSAEIDAATVGEVIEAAARTYGEDFRSLLPSCRVWLNGDPAGDTDPVGPSDEVAVLPPVSGGCGDAAEPPVPGCCGDADPSARTGPPPERPPGSGDR